MPLRLTYPPVSASPLRRFGSQGSRRVSGRRFAKLRFIRLNQGTVKNPQRIKRCRFGSPADLRRSLHHFGGQGSRRLWDSFAKRAIRLNQGKMKTDTAPKRCLFGSPIRRPPRVPSATQAGRDVAGSGPEMPVSSRNPDLRPNPTSWGSLPIHRTRLGVTKRQLSDTGGVAVGKMAAILQAHSTLSRSRAMRLPPSHLNEGNPESRAFFPSIHLDHAPQPKLPFQTW